MTRNFITGVATSLLQVLIRMGVVVLVLVLVVLRVLVVYSS